MPHLLPLGLTTTNLKCSHIDQEWFLKMALCTGFSNRKIIVCNGVIYTDVNRNEPDRDIPTPYPQKAQACQAILAFLHDWDKSLLFAWQDEEDVEVVHSTEPQWCLYEQTSASSRTPRLFNLTDSKTFLSAQLIGTIYLGSSSGKQVSIESDRTILYWIYFIGGLDCHFIQQSRKQMTRKRTTDAPVSNRI